MLYVICEIIGAHTERLKITSSANKMPAIPLNATPTNPADMCPNEKNSEEYKMTKIFDIFACCNLAII